MTRQPKSRRVRSVLLLAALILSLALAQSGCAYMTIERRGVTVVGREPDAP